MTIKDIAKLLLKMDKIEILTHHYPDGDTLGSAYGLCLALQQLGKKAKVTLAGKTAKKFNYLMENIEKQEFEPCNIVSVDVAAPSLLGENAEKYDGKINLCIDHHISNSICADYKYIEGDSAAAAEIVYLIIKEMNVKITPAIADCIYTGISTDTGCFMYVNTSPRTHIIAAELIKCGCDYLSINKAMFEVKSREMLKLERMLYDNMRFYCDGKCAVIYTKLKTQEELGIDDAEVEGIASIPRKIEGVLYGITVREKLGDMYKISVRTNEDADACAFCKRFGGGGHHGAAGCTLSGSLEEVISTLVQAVEECLT